MKYTAFIVSLFLLISCKEEPKKEIPILSNENEVEAISDMLDKQIEQEDTGFQMNDLLGNYVGMFSAKNAVHGVKASLDNKINVVIDSIINTDIYGHSVVAGNLRPFTGTINLDNYEASVKEPGDDKYDGTFNFKILDQGKKLEGEWIANNNKLKINERVYELNKMPFNYDPNKNLEDYGDEYEFSLPLTDDQDKIHFGGGEMEAISVNRLAKINASTTKLTNTDVENLKKGELEVLRNLIYARHGYSFKNRRMRYLFDLNVDWYIPMSTDIRDQLTDVEKQNIELIKRYEKHAETYYDYFGR